MTKPTRAQVESEFDELVAELGPPRRVTTTGPTPTATGDQDHVDALSFVIDPVDDGNVRTKRQAIEWGRAVMLDGVALYAGLCLRFVRLCFNVGALWPDAITAWVESPGKHPSTPAKAPRGHAGFFSGGDHGHVVLLLGNGRCLTNDTGAPGTINVALITDIEKAWGYPFLGYTDELNGEAPVPAPRPTPRRDRRKWRIDLLKRALKNARAAGHTKRAKRLREWIKAIASRA